MQRPTAPGEFLCWEPDMEDREEGRVMRESDAEDAAVDYVKHCSDYGREISDTSEIHTEDHKGVVRIVDVTAEMEPVFRGAVRE